MVACILLSAAGCQKVIEEPVGPSGKPFRLQVNVADAGIRTRSAALLPGEAKVGDLCLLFFDLEPGGSGRFVQAYRIADPAIGTELQLAVGQGEGASLRHGRDYAILAVANTEAYAGMGDFIDALETSVTEAQARKQLLALPAMFRTDALPMSGRTVKTADREVVDISLERAVVRIDVHNAIQEQYELISVAIYNAAERSMLWNDSLIDGITHTARFYGTEDEGSDAGIVDGSVTGGLYAFGNFENDPYANPGSTTSIVVALKSLKPPAGGELILPLYYRIPIRPDESVQNLMRNNIYRVSIQGVTGSGSLDEEDAPEGMLRFTINNWELDQDGLVVTDGQNTMAIPAKTIYFGPKAETRSYDLFTQGSGTLSIVRSDLPAGISASLEGNLLTISAEALSAGNDRRSGEIELGFGSLRGMMQVIQTPDATRFIQLNRSKLPLYAPMGATGITDGEWLRVLASDEWVATLQNPAPADPSNPGFLFNNGTTELSWSPGGLNPTWSSDSPFDILTTGSNPGRENRHSFVVFSLRDYPEYKQVLVLTQAAMPRITIAPDYDSPVWFYKDGTPVASLDNRIEIRVSSGTDIHTGEPNAWRVELTGADAQYFDVQTVTNDGNPRLYLTAKGTNSSYPGINLSTETLSASLVITLEGVTDDEAVEGETRRTLVVNQDYWSFLPERSSTLSTVPVTGTRNAATGAYTEYVEYTIDLPAPLRWNATITTQSHNSGDPWMVHRAYLLDAAGQPLAAGATLTDQTSAQKLRVGFDKIYYPLVDWPDASQVPQATIQISIAGLEGQPGMMESVTVSQDPLQARLGIVDLSTGGPGSLTAPESANHLKYYLQYMNATAMYGTGTNSEVRTVVNPATAMTVATLPGPIGANTNYVQVGSLPNRTGGTYTQAHHDLANQWWRGGNGLLVYAVDEPANTIFANSPSSGSFQTILSELGYRYKQPSDQTSQWGAKLNSGVADTRLMKYLLALGPFKKESWLDIGDVLDFLALGYEDTEFYIDASSTGLDPGSPGFSQGAVPVIVSDAGTEVLLMIDPGRQLIYWGDSQMFQQQDQPLLFGDANRYYSNGPFGTLLGIDLGTSNKSLFLANLIAFVLNTAQYGTHFTDLFDPAMVSNDRVSFMN